MLQKKERSLVQPFYLGVSEFSSFLCLTTVDHPLVLLVPLYLPQRLNGCLMCVYIYPHPRVLGFG